MAFALATLAAFANALSVVFQRIGVQNAPSRMTIGLGLFREAFRHLIWFAGLALILVGFLLQAGALRFGQLSSVQPIVTTELLFLVLILGVWFRYPLTWREWAGAAAAAGGLAAFLVVAAPGGGTVVPTLRSWTVTVVVVGLIVVATAALGFTGPRWFRAAMFGASGAVMFALSAALTKQFTNLISGGWGNVVTNWDPYALLATGLIGLLLIQSSLHAGPITASQATLTIVDPVASVAIGIWLFGDRLRTGGWRLPVEIVAIGIVVAGVIFLSRSPLVAGAKDESPTGDKLVRQPSRRVASVLD
ncbi:MAG: DMT family transporter [Acidimicrobiales bacterium]|nr:DMT family transporter [Acidimicrobiales bacterium]